MGERHRPTPKLLGHGKGMINIVLRVPKLSIRYCWSSSQIYVAISAHKWGQAHCGFGKVTV